MRLLSFHLFTIFLIFWLLPGGTFAQPITLTDGQEAVSATPYLSLLDDPSGNLTIEQVSSREYLKHFLPPDASPCLSTMLKIPEHICWIRLEIQQMGSNDWYLVTGRPSLAQMDAFIVDNTDQQIHSSGNMRKENSWQHVPTLKLPTTYGSPYHVYLRIRNLAFKTKDHLALQFVSTEALGQKAAYDHLIYGGIIMGFLTLAAYNLLLFGSLHNRGYLTLVALLVSLALLLQQIYNTIPWLSLVSNPDSLWFAAPLQLLLFSCIQFWRQLLDTKILMPRIDKTSTPLSLLILGITPFIHWLPDNEFWTSFPIILAILFASITGAIAIRRGSRMIRSVIPGFTVFVSGALPVTLARLGLLEDTDLALLNGIFAFGSLATGILLSLTLAEHTRQIRLRAEQATTENRVKDEFLTTMSHELRTPINSVVAVTELLKQSQLPAREKEYVSRLETASRHMLGLINDILDLSRLQLTKIPLNDNAFHLTGLLDHLKQMLQASTTEKNLTFRLHPPATRNLYLKGDPQRLSQVLLNLLGNAIKFTDQGSIDLHVREIGKADHGNISLHFEVADTGIGITPEDQTRLFQAFSQIDSQRTRRYGGSGLGLAISSRLVEAMGGKLELESTPGKGSRFFFTLEFPLQTNTPEETNLAGDFSEEPGESLAGQAPSTAITGRHILLIDDDEMNLFFGRELLNRLEAKTTMAGSGAQAIHELQQHTFDLVFMDVSMPGMDGYETTRQIRANPRFADLPIIALTAHAIIGERERCLAAGMDDYLTKPFTLVEMQAMIQRWTSLRNAC